MSSQSKKKRKAYQSGYEPSPLTGLSTKERNRALESNPEARDADIERVGRNIAAALANPDTPEIVRARIRAYVADVVDFDITRTPEVIPFLFPVARRKRTSVDPYVSNPELIEALTGNDMKQAIKAAREDNMLSLPVTITPKIAKSLTRILLNEDRNDEQANALVALVVGIVDETSPQKRSDIARAVCNRAYKKSDFTYDKEEEFIAQAIAPYRKKSTGKRDLKSKARDVLAGD